MQTLKDYLAQGECEVLGKTFFESEVGFNFVVKGFYGKPESRMASIDGIWLGSRSSMGSLKVSDILSCQRVFG